METLATRNDIKLAWEEHISQLHDVSAASMAGNTLNSAPFHNFYKQICQPASFDDSDISMYELLAQQQQVDASKQRLDEEFNHDTTTWIEEERKYIEAQTPDVDAFNFANSAFPNGLQISNTQANQIPAYPQAAQEENTAAHSDAPEA